VEAKNMDMENTGAIPVVSLDTSPLSSITDGHLAGLEQSSAALLVRSGNQKDQKFILKGNLILLGRSDEANIVLDDVTVSRKHALIKKDGNRWQILDQSSLNGIYVNFIRVEDSFLAAGDDIQIGKYRFTFLLPGQKI
jgi:pSer/pThr/pTyr-binding forkhead associated (FHA) protein